MISPCLNCYKMYNCNNIGLASDIGCSELENNVDFLEELTKINKQSKSYIKKCMLDVIIQNKRKL